MRRILIVDDNFVNRQLLQEMLQDQAQCDEAVDGKDALEKFRASQSGERYALILLDIAMPGVHGLEVLRAIREHEDKEGKPPAARVPIIITTAHKEMFVEAFRLGCTEYMTKPLDMVTLLAAVKRTIGI